MRSQAQADLDEARTAQQAKTDTEQLRTQLAETQAPAAERGYRAEQRESYETTVRELRTEVNRLRRQPAAGTTD